MVALEILTKRSIRKYPDLKYQISNNPKLGKKEALTVQRFIQEILIGKLGIPSRQIVNDTTFVKYTGAKRPDLLISEFEYDQEKMNDDEFVGNLVAYAEVKDGATVDDVDWNDAKVQGKKKSSKLKIPYFIVTNTKTSIFYNAKTGKEIKLNNAPIREFQTIDIFRLMKTKLKQKPTLHNIVTKVGFLSSISEATFNKKLWELAKTYRDIKFENNIEKIDFTVGFIALEFFEEKAEINGTKNKTKIYWSDCHGVDSTPEDIVAKLSRYIAWLEQESQFGEFYELMEKVRIGITGSEKELPKVKANAVKQIYDVINSMRPLHGTGFDLFGAVYEMFAKSNEKKDFGEYFTRRHYTHILSKLLLENEQYYDKDNQFKVLDLACGTGGFLTESFKILHSNYSKNNTLDRYSKKFLEKKCFHGFDVRKENISRTKLNMFLVGDGHTNMITDNTLERQFADDEKFDYIITNPPYGAGTISANSEKFSSKRTEVAFLFKIIELLKDGKRACVIIPDGILENPSFKKLRDEVLEKCQITAIISLPKFAFAPYTKEKTYAIYLTKKSSKTYQKKPIWMYIIDNDGLANSDKRFPTKLRIDREEWMHDEISGWVNMKGEEIDGLLEQRWMTFDDSVTGGTEWINENGEIVKLRKGGFVKINQIDKDPYLRLLPEFYFRPYEPKFITLSELKDEIKLLEIKSSEK